MRREGNSVRLREEKEEIRRTCGGGGVVKVEAEVRWRRRTGNKLTEKGRRRAGR